MSRLEESERAQTEARASELLDRPTPGAEYRVQRGDTLTSIAAQAYDVPPGRMRILAMQWVNAANPQCWVAPRDPHHAHWFPRGVVDLRPRFSSDDAEALLGKPGDAFPVLRIPERAELSTVSLRVVRWRLEGGEPRPFAFVCVDGALSDGFYSPDWPHARRLARRNASELWNQLRIEGRSAHPETRPRWERAGDHG